MTTIRRDISSIPTRTAEATWQEIIALVAGQDSKDVEQLEDATSVVASLIADELFSESHFTFSGVGPQLRIYLRHGADAVSSGPGIDPLRWNPTAGDWVLYLPCDDENMSWVSTALATRAPRIHVHAVGEQPWQKNAETSNARESNAPFDIDWSALR